MHVYDKSTFIHICDTVHSDLISKVIENSCN